MCSLFQLCKVVYSRRPLCQAWENGWNFFYLEIGKRQLEKYQVYMNCYTSWQQTMCMNCCKILELLVPDVLVSKISTMQSSQYCVDKTTCSMCLYMGYVYLGRVLRAGIETSPVNKSVSIMSICHETLDCDILLLSNAARTLCSWIMVQGHYT